MRGVREERQREREREGGSMVEDLFADRSSTSCNVDAVVSALGTRQTGGQTLRIVFALRWCVLRATRRDRDRKGSASRSARRDRDAEREERK